MSFGIQTNYRPQMEVQELRAKQTSYLDNVDKYGGIRLEQTKALERENRPEPSPELKSIRDRAPYVEQGKTIDTARRFAPDPDSALGQLLTEIEGLREIDPPFHEQCMKSLEQIRDAYTALKSPPESGITQDYIMDLGEQIGSLEVRQDGLHTGGVDHAGKPELRQKLEGMLDQVRTEVGNYRDYVQTLPDPHPTMQDVGHFKSFETQGAINVLDEYVDKKFDQIKAVLGDAVDPESWMEDFQKVPDGQFEVDLAELDIGAGEKQALRGLRQEMRVLLDTRAQLETRLDIMNGVDPNDDTFNGDDPLDARQMKEVLGSKPGVFEKLFGKLGWNAYGQSVKAVEREIRDGGMPPPTNAKMSESKMMVMVLQQRLEQAGMGKLSEKELGHAVEEQHVHALGKQQNWDVIDRQVTQNIDGELRTFQSILTPQSRLPGKPEGLEKGTGVCCHDGSTGTSVNVWQSELKDETGKTLFRQVRTAVNCAYDIEDEGDRKTANKGRAKQLLETHVNSDPGVQKQMKEGKGTPDNPIVLRNLWVSHLTPDLIRDVFFKPNEKEGRMAREQNEAMQSLSQELQTFTVPTGDGVAQEIHVKYEPIMFSFGVNAGAVNPGSFLIGGWMEANSFNEPSMTVLFGEEGAKGGKIGGWVSDVLSAKLEEMEDAERELNQLHETFGDDPVDGEIAQRMRELKSIQDEANKSIERIDALARQVQDLWQSKDFMLSGEDPYKMSARLGVLGNELGAAVTSNCKSNKDRNSFGDTNMKDLAIQMHTKGELRAPNQPRSQEEKTNLRTLTRECGNHELQRYNVGGAGYKLEKVARVYFAQGLEYHDANFTKFGKYTAT